MPENDQPQPLTEEQISEWAQLAMRATPGPWSRHGGSPPAVVTHANKTLLNPQRHFLNSHGEPVGEFVGVCSGFETNRNWAEGWLDLEFIAASRDAVPALIAEIRRLQAIIKGDK